MTDQPITTTVADMQIEFAALPATCAALNVFAEWDQDAGQAIDLPDALEIARKARKDDVSFADIEAALMAMDTLPREVLWSALEDDCLI